MLHKGKCKQIIKEIRLCVLSFNIYPCLALWRQRGRDTEQESKFWLTVLKEEEDFKGIQIKKMSGVATLGGGCSAAAAMASPKLQTQRAKSIMALPMSANSNCNSFFSFNPKALPPPSPISAKSSSSVKTAVAAVDSDQISSSDPPEKVSKWK